MKIVNEINNRLIHKLSPREIEVINLLEAKKDQVESGVTAASNRIANAQKRQISDLIHRIAFGADHARYQTTDAEKDQRAERLLGALPTSVRVMPVDWN